jgi:hypothetical protein
MRVLVVGSCGKKKLYEHSRQPSCHEMNKRHGIEYWKKKLAPGCAPARDMYTGPQSSELVKAVDLLRTIPNVEVQLVIISAGFGVLLEEDIVPPYDCSFTTMNMADVRKRALELMIQSSFTNLLNNEYDFLYLGLGKRYLAALGKEIISEIQTPTILFHGEESNYLVRVPCAADTVKAFSKRGHKIHGVVGFKGDLLRILAKYALDKPNPLKETNRWSRTNYLRKLVHQLGGLKSN